MAERALPGPLEVLLARASTFARARLSWRQHSTLALCGGLSTLAHAPFFMWPILFVTFPVLFWSIEGAGDNRGASALRRAAVSGLVFAFGYFFTGLYWIGEAFLVEADIFAWMLPFAITLLPLMMALYWALAAALTRWTWIALGLTSQRGPAGALRRALIFAVMFSSFEWVRGHAFTGFPWHNPGLVLTAPLELMQAAALVGMYGLAPFAFLVTMTPAVVLAASRADMRGLAQVAIVVVAVLPLAAAYGYGAWRLAEPAPPDVAGVALRIVQPSVPQREKWRADKQAEFFQRHLELSRKSPDGRIDDLAGITHVVWPEAAMPFGPLHNQQALDAIAELLPDGVHLIAGVLRRGDQRVQPGAVHNSLVALDTTGKLVALYDKTHLVPFGEYLPFPSVLEAIGLQNLVRQRGGFAAGPTPKPPFSVPGLPPMAAVICYEAIFPGEIAPTGGRTGAIVIATNDGWFGRSIGPAQHFHQARVRAVEQGLPVIRAANNGISAMIDPAGRVRSKLDLDVVGTLDTPLPGARPPTLAIWLGEYGLICSNVLLLLMFISTYRVFRHPTDI